MSACLVFPIPVLLDQDDRKCQHHLYRYVRSEPRDRKYLALIYNSESTSNAEHEIRFFVHVPTQACLSFIRKDIIRSFAGNFSYEAACTDGEIYYNMRRYQSQRDDQGMRSWKNILSDFKVEAVDYLLPRGKILDALDRVMLFPGMRSGFQLGNIDKHLATHYDEQIINYLSHIDRICDALVRCGKADRLVVDDHTVRLLQFRAPLTSKADRGFVNSAMDTGYLSPTITEPNFRKKMHDALLSLDVIIPSLAIFHENMKYLTIGAKVLKERLDIPHKNNGVHSRDTTLYRRLMFCWDSDCRPLIETNEGYFLTL